MDKMNKVNENAEKFEQLFKENIKREGADGLLEYLKDSDFFLAPASTKYHGAVEGGLCEHSINVYKRLKEICERENIDVSAETIAICGLLHDICKIGLYAVGEKWNEEKTAYEPYYYADDKLPMGHGEKSVFIIQQYMKLTDDEAMAIRWHMGAWDDAVRGGCNAISKAQEMYRFVTALHIADMCATWFDERGDKQ